MVPLKLQALKSTSALLVTRQKRATLPIELRCSSSEWAQQQSSSSTISKSRSWPSRTVACTTAWLETPEH